MNRLKISAGILVILAVLCISGLFLLHHQCEKFSDQATLIMESVTAGKTEDALQDCEALFGQWEEFHDITGVFVDGERLDPIREIMAGLPELIAAEHPEVMSRLETLRTLTEDLFLEELPDWWHIL